MRRQEVTRVNADDLDYISTALITGGINTVKRNPIKFSLYLIGLLLCLLFNGFSVDQV